MAIVAGARVVADDVTARVDSPSLCAAGVWIVDQAEAIIRTGRTGAKEYQTPGPDIELMFH